MNGHRKDRESVVAKDMQAMRGPSSVEDEGHPMSVGSVMKEDPNVGMYPGCPNPATGVDYAGSGIKAECDDLQVWTKGESSGGGKGANQTKKGGA